MKLGCSQNCGCLQTESKPEIIPNFIQDEIKKFGRTYSARKGILNGATTLEELFPIGVDGKRSFNFTVKIDLTSALYLGGAIMAGTLLSGLTLKAIK